MKDFEYSSEEREILVYGFNYETREFIGEYVAHIAPNTGLPGNSTVIEPPQVGENQVAVYNIESESWDIIDDFRGHNIWHKITKKQILVDVIGEIPEKYTHIKPGSDFDVWDGEKWVKDIAAETRFRLKGEEQHKELLMSFAESRIALLSRAVDKGIATNAEIEILDKWEIYTVLLNRVDVSQNPVVYPETPE